MAMRLFSAEEFSSELMKRGCRSTGTTGSYGTLWATSDGRHFTVPESEENGRFPDFMLDELISRLRLPAKPRDN